MKTATQPPTRPNDFIGRAIGEEYDLLKLAVPHHDEFQQTVADEVRRYCLNAPGREPIRLLEIGVGTGLTTEEILRAHERVIVLGVDKAKNMLEQARTRLKSYIDSRRLLLYQADVSHVFDDFFWFEDFDIVASAYTIHNLPEKEKRTLFENIYYALEPNGLFIEADVISHDNLAQHERELAIRLKNLEAFDRIGKPEVRQEWIQHHLYDDQPGIRMTEAELREMLSEVGFRDIQRTYRRHLEATFVARK